jgi:hypothetical protein
MKRVIIASSQDNNYYYKTFGRDVCDEIVEISGYWAEWFTKGPNIVFRLYEDVESAQLTTYTVPRSRIDAVVDDDDAFADLIDATADDITKEIERILDEINE